MITSQNAASVENPKGFLTTLLGIEADEFQVIETEQFSMKTHLADSFIRVTIGNKQVIVHCEFQNANRVGLVPFATLMKPPADMAAPEWIRRCVRAVEAGSQDEVQQRETLSDLAILGGLAHDAQTIRDIISEEIVQESSIIQYFTEKSFEQGIEQGIERGIERGIEQGKKQYAVEAILTVLDIHFQNGVAEKLKPFLEAIDDLERLDHLHRVAARASDIGEFTDALLNLKN